MNQEFTSQHLYKYLCGEAINVKDGKYIIPIEVNNCVHDIELLAIGNDIFFNFEKYAELLGITYEKDRNGIYNTQFRHKPNEIVKFKFEIDESKQTKLNEMEKINFLSDSFYTILQNKPINNLSKVRTNNLFGQLDFLGNAEIKIDDSFTLKIKDYIKLGNGIPTTAWMLLDCFLIHFTEQTIKDTRIRLPLNKYMEMRELSDPKTAREQVLRDMKALQLIEYEAREKIGRKWVNSGIVSIFGGTGYIKNSVIYFNFNTDFYNALLTYRVMEYSKETLKLNPKQNPHAYYFSRYIDENYRLNEGKERVSIISIATLMNKAPHLLTYNEVMESPTHKGRVYDFIIEPVIRDLDSIDRLYYDFVKDNGDIITNPLDLFKGTGGYEKFITSKIKIDYGEYINHTQRIERQKKHTEKARRIKQNNAKTKGLELRITALENEKSGGNGWVIGG